MGCRTRKLCISLASVCEAVLLFAAPEKMYADEVLFDRSSTVVRDRAIVVPNDRFTLSFIEQLGRSFVRDTVTEKVLARLTMAASRDGLAHALFQSHSHPTYDSTIGDIRNEGLPEVPVARVLILNGSAMFSYRDRNGYTEHLIAGTGNPLTLREMQTDFEILHFTLTPPGPALRPSDYSLAVYLRASPNVSISACEAVTKALWKQTKVFSLRVEVRPDVFFLTNLDFPAIYPFRADLTLPNKTEVELAPYAGCAINQTQELRCGGHNFQP